MRFISLLVLLPGIAAAQNAQALNNQKERTSYALGTDLGTQLRKSSVEIDPALFTKGLKDGLAGTISLMTEKQVRTAISELQAELKKREYGRQRKSPEESEAELKLLASYNKSTGDAFLAANKKKPGVVVLPSGLQYKVVKEGSGPKPNPGDTVKCNYRIALLNGTEFFNTFKTQQPTTLKVNEVLKGLNEALKRMPVGSRWEIVVPPELGYGENGQLPIGPNATLNYEIEVLGLQ